MDIIDTIHHFSTFKNAKILILTNDFDEVKRMLVVFEVKHRDKYLEDVIQERQIVMGEYYYKIALQEESIWEYEKQEWERVKNEKIELKYTVVEQVENKTVVKNLTSVEIKKIVPVVWNLESFSLSYNTYLSIMISFVPNSLSQLIFDFLRFFKPAMTVY